MSQTGKSCFVFVFALRACVRAKLREGPRVELFRVARLPKGAENLARKTIDLDLQKGVHGVFWHSCQENASGIRVKISNPPQYLDCSCSVSDQKSGQKVFWAFVSKCTKISKQESN